LLAAKIYFSSKFRDSEVWRLGLLFCFDEEGRLELSFDLFEFISLESFLEKVVETFEDSRFSRSYDSTRKVNRKQTAESSPPLKIPASSRSRSSSAINISFIDEEEEEKAQESNVSLSA
jgi:hypothetical protein